ncbi:hypothetical protein [Luteimonas sp. R10]|uniref:hypothetical protein n=1 Tax=Luteimonas sp. R10 TaxID=3108176 RepID=UPI00308F7D13|nr:hypothetical protein U3649_10815 [Luteimonas sp. R10]
MTRDREPLTPEERALAERLARTSPRAEPPPALDARILAAARAATEAPTGSARPRRRRWPATLGIAASLALAVGIAWQLRPLPQAPPPASEVPASEAAAPRPAESAAQAIADVPAAPADERAASARRPVATQQAVPERREPAPAPRSPPTPASAATGQPGPETETVTAPARKAARQAVEATQAGERSDAARGASERQRESAIVFDAPSAAGLPAPPPPAPMPAPAAEPAFVPSPPPVDTAIGRRRVQQRAAARPDAVAPLPQRDARERIEVTGTSLPAAPPTDMERAPFLDQPLDDEPPATADSPEVHKAWLARIRELHADGEHEAARESLREFHRRHPDVELPEDLSGLLDE